MRKVLLTTTALVAFGGASVASAMDISGSYAFDYRDNSNSGASADAANVSGNSFGSDSLISFSGSSTADSGLTFGAKMTLNGSGGIEDQGMYISGDFGYFMGGQTDGVVDGMDGFMLGSALVEVGNGTVNGSGAGVTGSSGVGLKTSAMVADNPGTGKVGYRSPEVSGFQVGVSYEDAGSGAAANNDNTAWIVTYDLGVAKLGYAQSKTGNASNTGADVTNTNYGLGMTLAGVTFGGSVGTAKTAGAAGTADTSKIDTTDVGLSYSVNDATGIYVAMLSSEEKTGDNAGDKMEGNTYGLTYSVAPGVGLLVEYADTDYTDATSGGTNTDGRTSTSISLSVSF
jgi:hypothetical protein